MKRKTENDMILIKSIFINWKNYEKNQCFHQESNPSTKEI